MRCFLPPSVSGRSAVRRLRSAIVGHQAAVVGQSVMSDCVIKFDSVSKSYKIHERGYRSFRGEFANWMRRIAQSAKRKANNVSHSAQSTPLSAPNTLQSSQEDDILWALKDVSFKVNRGEVLGIIGANGSGKTTILRILSGVTSPTKGTVSVNGKVAPLIQVGAGFHPELTGRENVYLNATIMGLSKNEIDEKYDDIVSFAELERFMDTPVKRYSSGMYVRLGFAVVANINPDIFLIDEILSVGDLSFQRKCLETMRNIQKSDKSIVFISHNLSAVKGLCDRIVWLDKGEIQKEGSPDEVINAYTAYMTSKSQLVNDTSYVGGKTRWGSGEITIEKIELINTKGEVSNTFIRGEDIKIKINYKVQKKVEPPIFWLWISNTDEVKIVGFCYNELAKRKVCINKGGILECKFKMMDVFEGNYFLMVGIYDEISTTAYDRIGRSATFSIKYPNNEFSNNIYKGYILDFPCSWKHKIVDADKNE